MNELIKAFFKTGFGSILTMAFTIVSTKILAVMLGPQWTGLSGLLAQIITTAAGIATLSGASAIIQGAAARKAGEREGYLATVLWVLLILNGVVSGVILGLAPFIARTTIGADDATTVMLVRLLVLPMIASNLVTFLTSMLNAYRGIGRLAIVQIAGGIVSAGLAYPVALGVRAGNPALIILPNILAPLAMLILTAGFLARAGWLQAVARAFRQGMQRRHARHFLVFSSVTLVTGLVLTGSQLIVRTLITRNFGLEGVGIFNAAWTISMTYVTLVVTALSTYYLPSLSQLDDTAARAQLMQQVLRLVIVILPPLIAGVILFKPLVIRLLFAESYAPALNTMRWMMIGDYFKVTSWVLAMPMLARADMKAFFWSEIVTFLSFLLFSAIMVVRFRWMEGVGLGFMLMYIGYLIYTLFYARKAHSFRVGRFQYMQWVFGLMLVICVAWITWNDITVNFTKSSIILVIILICTGFEPFTRRYIYKSKYISSSSFLRK
jgi:PST family polysaccharide transporter